MTWPMLVYSALMLAMCVTLLKRMFILPRKEYTKQYAETLGGVDSRTVSWFAWFTTAIIVCYFWLTALALAQSWLYVYAAYKTTDSVVNFRKAVSPDKQRYPSLLRKLATFADFIVIVYVVVDTFLRR